MRWGFRGLPDKRAFVLPNAILANTNGYVFALLKSAQHCAARDDRDGCDGFFLYGVFIVIAVIAVILF